jgi:hypothetical protein
VVYGTKTVFIIDIKVKYSSKDYERKICALPGGSSRNGGGQAVAAGEQQLDTMGSLFGNNSVPNTPFVGESSPYGDTALLRTRYFFGPAGQQF